MPYSPVTLAGRHVRLEPLAPAHLDGLAAIALDPEIWRWMPLRVTTRDDVRKLIDDAAAELARGDSVPFATVLAAENRVIGSTRFLALAPAHRRVEIGWTFLGRAWQRTAANTEAKYLMLRHAFETWDCARVELKTHAKNDRSRAAIRRLGAIEEGTLRSHMTMPDGPRRDSVYYSVLADEWPAVRSRLEARLG